MIIGNFNFSLSSFDFQCVSLCIHKLVFSRYTQEPYLRVGYSIVYHERALNNSFITATDAWSMTGRLDVILNENTANQPNLKSKSMLMISQRLAEKLLTQLSTFNWTVPNISAGQTSPLLIFDCVISRMLELGYFHFVLQSVWKYSKNWWTQKLPSCARRNYSAVLPVTRNFCEVRGSFMTVSFTDLPTDYIVYVSSGVFLYFCLTELQTRLNVSVLKLWQDEL